MESLRVLHKPYNTMMRDHLLRMADDLAERRPIPTTKEEWEERRAAIRGSLILSLGLPRERTPLNPRITGIYQRDGYRMEKLIFESRPKWYVTANVYVPDRADFPTAAVLCPHGHWGLGRYEAPVQARSVGLAKRGYVVLSLDKVGYNERKPMGHRHAQFLPMAGFSLQGLQVWDNMRAIDYLCSRDEVDPERIGCTGASGGGNQTMYVSALDERIKAAVPVCSVEVIERYMIKPFCTCETIPGIMRYADLTDICALIAPRALLLVHGMLDEGFPVRASRRAYRAIHRIFSLYGCPGKLDFFESFAEHDYNREMREAMYAWFDRWLMGKPLRRAEEGPVEVEPPSSEALKVCGNEGLPKGHGTVISLYRSAVKDLPPRSIPKGRAKWTSWREVLKSKVIETLGGFPEKGELDPKVVGTDDCDGLMVERLYFKSEFDVLIPAFLARPKGKGSPVATIFISPEGKEGAAYRILGRDLEGRAAFGVDLRGTGETAGNEQQNMLAGITLGRTIFAMRVWDVIRSVDYLLSRGDIGSVEVEGCGSPVYALIALYAGALDERITSVTVEGPLLSYKEGELQGLDSAFIPGILKCADVPDIAALVAPRKLAIRSPVIDAGKPASPEELERHLLPVRQVYALLGEERKLAVVTGC